LVPKLRRNAALSMTAGHWRCAGAELWRSARDISLRRRATQSCTRHLYPDALSWFDAWSPVWRRADLGLGLAFRLLVPNPDRPRGAALIPRRAGIAAAKGRRSLRRPGRRFAGARPRHDALGPQPPARDFRGLVRSTICPRLRGIHLPRVTR